MSDDSETIAVYERNVTEYAALTGQTPTESLEAFASVVPAGGAILDWGCGPGHDAIRFATMGFNVEAVDASTAMVAHAIDRYELSARCETFKELNVVAAYDGVWANFSLLHALRCDMPRHLRAAQLALREGGAFYVSVKCGAGEKRDSLGRRYSYYSKSELLALLEAAGFELRSSFSGVSIGLDGMKAAWIGLLLGKA